MNPARDERGDVLTVLTVREDEATVRDFRCDCRGETSCRPDLGELVQLLERRRADVAVFLSHPELVASLVAELQRRRKHVPEMVIASAADAFPARRAGPGDRPCRISVSLSGLSELVSPQEILASLYEALCAAQGLTPSAAPSQQTEPADDAPPAAAPGPAPPTADGDTPPPQPAAPDDVGGGHDWDETGARLERILEQRLRQRPQP